MADIEYVAMQRRSSLDRDDGHPIVIGRDTPSAEQLALAEAGEIDPFDGEPEPEFCGRDLVDVDAKGRV